MRNVVRKAFPSGYGPSNDVREKGFHEYFCVYQIPNQNSEAQSGALANTNRGGKNAKSYIAARFAGNHDPGTLVLEKNIH